MVNSEVGAGWEDSKSRESNESREEDGALLDVEPPAAEVEEDRSGLGDALEDGRARGRMVLSSRLTRRAAAFLVSEWLMNMATRERIR